jgi:hypothetical protein
MFQSCVARGIAAKLEFKTVCGAVETPLVCQTSIAASTFRIQGRQHPANQRRRQKCKKWLLRKKSARIATSTTAGVEAANAATAASPVDQPPLAVDQPPLAVDQPNLAVDQPNLAVKEPDAAFDQPATLKAATEPPPKKKSTRGQTPTRRSARNVVAAKRRPTASPEMERSSPSHGLILSHYDNLDLDIDLSTDCDPEYPTAPPSLKPPPSPPPLLRALPTPALPTTAPSTADLHYYSSAYSSSVYSSSVYSTWSSPVFQMQDA